MSYRAMVLRRSCPKPAFFDADKKVRQSAQLQAGGLDTVLAWKPPLETAGVTYHEAVDEATGITVVVECDHPGSPESWVWYLANYPVVSREPADNDGPLGRATTKEAAVEAATKALPTLMESAHLKKQEKKLTRVNNDRRRGVGLCLAAGGRGRTP